MIHNFASPKLSLTMNLTESRTQGYLGEIFFFIFYHRVEIQVSREILQLVQSLLFLLPLPPPDWGATH